MKTYMVKTTIASYVITPYCLQCGWIPKPGNKYEVNKIDDTDLVFCPKCKWCFSKKNSDHIVNNSTEVEMAVPIVKFDYEKTRKDVLEALKVVIESIANAEIVDTGEFNLQSEYHEGYKTNVWKHRYPNGWQNLSISIRYKVKDQDNTCSGSGSSRHV